MRTISTSLLIFIFLLPVVSTSLPPVHRALIRSLEQDINTLREEIIGSERRLEQLRYPLPIAEIIEERHEALIRSHERTLTQLKVVLCVLAVTFYIIGVVTVYKLARELRRKDWCLCELERKVRSARRIR